MSYNRQSDGTYHIPIIDLGERLRDHFGLTIKEHEHFDPVDRVHANNSYHYHGEAIDVQDWRDDLIDGVDWRTRTGNLEDLLKGSGVEILGPNSGVAGHDSHLHLAAKNGLFKLNEYQYNALFGDNTGGRAATFASNNQPAVLQSEAKERAQNYKDMSKEQLNAAYDAMRSEDPEKARIEGMKMHKEFFNKP